MALLEFIEGIRHPMADWIFSLITSLGEETFLIVLGLAFLWCINKKHGYYLFFVGFFGLVTNQLLKFIFRVPRPWIKNPDLSIVETTRPGAVGYSFPSGHTQLSVGLYGGLARLYRRPAVRVPCISLAVLIGFSRLYLGVHTPVDVFVSAVIALFLIFLFYPLLDLCYEKEKRMHLLFLGHVLFCLSFLLYVCLYPFPENTDMVNLLTARQDGYKILGVLLGFWISFWVDRKFLHYEVETTIPWQLLKLVLGAFFAIAVKELLKAPLLSLFGGHEVAGLLRYLAMAVFAGCIWPMLFHFLPKKKTE